MIPLGSLIEHGVLGTTNNYARTRTQNLVKSCQKYTHFLGSKLGKRYPD